MKRLALMVVAVAALAASPALAATYYCGVAPIDGAPLGDTWRLDVAGGYVDLSDAYGMAQRASLGPQTRVGGMTLRDFTVRTVGGDVGMVLEVGGRTVSLTHKGGPTLACLPGEEMPGSDPGI